MKKKTEKRRLGLAIRSYSGSRPEGFYVFDRDTEKVLFTVTAKRLLAMRDELKRLRKEVKELQPSLRSRGERTERFAGVGDD